MGCPHGDEPSRCWRCLRAQLQWAEAKISATNMAAIQLEGELEQAQEKLYEAERRMDGWAIAMRQANRITSDLRADGVGDDR